MYKRQAGVYMMLPMGNRVLSKIYAIIRDEMNKIDCQELSMPSLIPEEEMCIRDRDVSG